MPMEFLARDITVTLAAADLTGDGGGVAGLKISGQSIVDAYSLAGASAAKARGRGGDVMAIEFTSLKIFSSSLALDQFQLSHFSTLVKSGELVMTDANDVEYTATTAAVQSVSFGDPEGLWLPVTYSIVSSPLLVTPAP